MATQFSDLYDEFLQTEVEDTKLQSRTPDYLSFYLALLLKRARERFRDLAYRNSGFQLLKMEDVVESVRQTYDFSATGTSTTQTLSPAPPANAEFYVTVNNVVTTSFTFDSGTNEITITNMPNQTNTIYVGTYTDGQFNQTLNLTENGIIIDLMGNEYLKDKNKAEKHINQRVYGRDYGMHSQASHIKSITETYDLFDKRIAQRINLYTYRQSPDNLERLGSSS